MKTTAALMHDIATTRARKEIAKPPLGPAMPKIDGAK